MEGNGISAKSFSVSVKRYSTQQSESFAIETPVKAWWSVKVDYMNDICQSKGVTFYYSIINVPASRMISSNYQFIFNVGTMKEISGALTSTETKFTLLGSQIVNFIGGDNFKATLTFRIKYVGHPRMREKVNDLSAYSSVPLLKDLLENPVLADFQFLVMGKEFNVHKNVMAKASPVLLRMFTSDMAENKEGVSRIDHIEPEVFEAMLKFIHNIAVPLNINRRCLYAAAHLYQIEPLKDLCEQEVHTSLSVDNALGIFLWADPYEELEGLKYDAWDIIKRELMDNLDLGTMKNIVEHVKASKQSLAYQDDEPLKKL